MRKISVITVTYNSEKTLEQTIKSVLKQGYPMIEYIVIDGGSTDATLDIIDKYKQDISYFVTEPDRGISDAFNKGIEAASGEIIGIINSDDLLYGYSLFKVNDFFEANTDIDILHGNVLRFDDGENVGRLARPGDDWQSFQYKFLIYHPSVFVKKETYEKYGLFNIEYKNAMDYELISRMYFCGARIQYMDEIISCFRLGGESERTNKKSCIEHEKVALRNGTKPRKAKKYAWYLYARAQILITFKKIHLDSMVRRLLKRPDYLSLE